MYKKLLVFSFLVFLLTPFSSIANAQTTTSPDTNANSAARLKRQMRDIKEQKKEAISQIRQEAKETRVELRKQIKETVQMKREKAKEVISAKKEKFKARLQTIKDQKKQVLVERIDGKLENVNTKHTDRFTEVLGNLQMILDKISVNATEEKVIADTKIAQLAIDKAKTAVENQASKTYVITISTEKALRANVGATTSQLRLDLMATHKLVVDAKQAVQALRKNRAMMKKEATRSANL